MPNNDTTKCVEWFCQRCVVGIKTVFVNWGLPPQVTPCPKCGGPLMKTNRLTSEDGTLYYEWFRPVDKQEVITIMSTAHRQHENVIDAAIESWMPGTLVLRPVTGANQLQYNEYNEIEQMVAQGVYSGPVEFCNAVSKIERIVIAAR